MARRRLRAGSVRTRVTAVATLAVATALALGAVALILSLERSLTRSGDDLSRSRVEDLSALVQAGALPRTLTDVGDESVAQVVTADGRVLAASPNLDGLPPIDVTGPLGPVPAAPTTSDVPDDDGTEAYRIWAAETQAPTGPVRIYVGRSLESVSDVLTVLTRNLLIGAPLLVVMLGLVIWLMVGRTLRPVERIRTEVASISHEDLGRRVPVPPYDDEVGRLATTMNQMLVRLERSSRSQREFVANASHELQSPLAALRTELEVSLAHPEDTDWPATARTLQADGDEMERLVRDLLFLAGEDERLAVVTTDLVDLDDVVLEEAARLRDRAPAVFEMAGVTAAPVRGSRDDLARLVRNLLENATHHARGQIVVELAVDEERAACAVLSVWDDGDGIDVGDRERIFERFYRGDSSRSPRASGTGLGLAIVRSIAERYSGSVELADCETGTRFVVRLPAA